MGLMWADDGCVHRWHEQDEGSDQGHQRGSGRGEDQASEPVPTLRPPGQHLALTVHVERPLDSVPRCAMGGRPEAAHGADQNLVPRLLAGWTVPDGPDPAADQGRFTGHPKCQPAAPAANASAESTETGRGW